MLTNKIDIKRSRDLMNSILINQNSKLAVHDEIQVFSDLLSYRVKTRGTKETVEHFKSLHLLATRVALEKSFQPIPFLKSNRKGFPKKLNFLKKFLTGTPTEKRIGLSITIMYKSIYLQPSDDFEEIIRPGYELPYCKSWNDFLNRKLRCHKPLNLRWDKEWRETIKSGPNGPAMITCHHDLYAISQDPEVRDNLLSWTLQTDPQLHEEIEDRLEVIKENDGELHSTIGIIPEGGGKTRQVAIVDYWTQESLKSLFKALQKILSRLETDGTYNQRHLVDKMSTAMRQGKSIHCFDLKSATDRFPASLQEDTIAALIGRDKAKAWLNLLTKRTFIHKSKKIRYGAGQPMGILSSWSAFALTHHMVIEYAAELEGHKSFRDYVLLGDDVAIFDTKVAYRYLKMMTLWGVEISLQKSHLWTPGDPHPISGEIAKRILLRSEEITPIPYKLIQTWSKKPLPEVSTLLYGLTNIGIVLDTPAWETLSRTVSKKQRRDFLILAHTPLGLKSNTLMGHAPQIIEGDMNPWSVVDTSRIPWAMSEVLINHFESKEEELADAPISLLEEKRRICDFLGDHISHFDLIQKSSYGFDLFHPFAQVINRRERYLLNLWDTLKENLEDPEIGHITWKDVYQANMYYHRNYIPEVDKHMKARLQSRLILKLYKSLPLIGKAYKVPR